MKRFSLLIFHLILSCFYLNCLYSQNITIAGKVTSIDNTPLEGVSVRLKDASLVVSTDNEGNYKVVVPNGNGSLVFSSVGYIEQEVAISSRLTINVSLKEGNKQLEDVVVIGYGAVRKKDLTGSVSQVRSKEIAFLPITAPFRHYKAGQLVFR